MRICLGALVCRLGSVASVLRDASGVCFYPNSDTIADIVALRPRPSGVIVRARVRCYSTGGVVRSPATMASISSSFILAKSPHWAT